MHNYCAVQGNLMLTRDYPGFSSDMVTVLAAAGATVQYLYANGLKTETDIPSLLAVPLDQPLMLLTLKIPATANVGCTDGVPALLRTYKTSQRHVFSHAIVNVGVYWAFATDRTVAAARIFVGGACASS